MVENEKEFAPLEREIKKLKPPVEVSIESVSDIAKGRLIEWSPSRKLFIVKWEKRSEQFSEITNSKTGLRVFFKLKLFSTQLVFKTTTVRRQEDGTYHYRMPSEIFQQQRRGALRVPLKPGVVKLKSAEGTFELVDLSVSGAKVKTPKNAPRFGAFTECELILDGYKIKTPEFEARLTFLDPTTFGIRFSGLNDEIRLEIKQFLINALRDYYEEL